MLVSELFTRLSYGVFSNLAIGMEGAGDIATAKKPVIITHLNEALLKLHSRFMLKQADLLIMQDAGIRYYPLLPEHAQTNPTPAPGADLFIMDTAEKPFTGDVIKVLEVRGPTGQLLALNDPESFVSVFTPQPHILQVPTPVSGDLMGVVYQASHKVVGPSEFTASIDIPRTVEPALISYIAFLIFSGVSSDGAQAKAAEQLALYEACCSELEEKDLVNSSFSLTNVRFDKNGWV